MATANEVRQFVLATYINPGRHRGDNQVSFTSYEIHQGMGLSSRFPLVCSAIDASKFLDLASVNLIKREGPKQSSTVRWVFGLKK